MEFSALSLKLGLIVLIHCGQTQEKPKAVLSIKPDNHVFRGEKVTLRCDLMEEGDSEWTYSWYMNDNTVYTSSRYHGYEIYYVRESESGKYTCRGERRRRSETERSEISNAVTLTVSAKPRPVLSVTPQSWLTEGASVTLSCEIIGSSIGWTFSWYRNKGWVYSAIRTGSGGSYTLSPAAFHQTGVYYCIAERGDPEYETEHSNSEYLLINASSPSASLIVSPSRSQHFSGDSLSLSCEGKSNSTGWRVRRYTDRQNVSDCSSDWGSVTGSTCSICPLSTPDTGVYWCESESGGKSDPVTIKVHYGDVILESPVNPVTERDPLTLRCLYRQTMSSNLSASEFYKFGLLIQNQSTGEMTIPKVSKSHEGLYYCKLPEKGKSPQSWILVRGSPFSVLHLLSSLVAASPYVLATIILGVKCYRARAKPAEEERTHAVIEAEDSL